MPRDLVRFAGVRIGLMGVRVLVVVVALVALKEAGVL